MLPINLKLENFFSHKNSEIDFSLFNSALLVGSVDGDYSKSNGSGKCLGEHTVLTDPITGERISIKDLHDSGRTDFKVFGMNSDYTLSPTNVIKTAFSGKKELLKITMDNGLFEIVSKTHPVFTEILKTQNAEDIKVGQYVAQPRHMKIISPTNKINIARARILSLFMAEGSLTSNNTRFTNTDKEIVDITRLDLSNEFFAGLCASQYMSSNMSRNNFEKHATHLKNKNYINLSKSDLLWAKVVSIEEAGIGDTYDIEIDNQTKLYALDGFITHNSALLEGLLWVLYNKSRATTMDDVIMWGENKCVVSLHFSHSGEEYLIKRTRLRDTSTSSVDLLSLDETGKWKSLSGSTSGDTNDRIVDLLKIDYKTFVNSAYFRQNDISEFVTSEASKKKEILKNIVDISKWDLYEKSAKKKIKDLQVDLLKAQTTYDALRLEVDILSVSENELTIALALLDEKTKQKQSIQPKIDMLSEKYLKIKNNIDTDSWDKATTEIRALKIRGKDLKTRYDSVMSVLERRLGRKDELSGSILSFEKKISTLSFDDNIEQKLEKLQNEFTEYSGAIQQSKIKLKELSDLKLIDGECYTCHHEIGKDDYDRLSSEHQKSVEHYSNKKTNSESRIVYLSSLKTELISQREDNFVIEKSKDEIRNISSQLSMLEEEIASGEIEKNEIYSNMLAVKQGIIDSEEVLLSLKDESFQSLHDELKTHKNNFETLSEEILESSIRVGSLKEKSISLNKKKEELISIKKSFDEKNGEMAIFDKMMKMFGKGGIQTLLLEAVISDLEKSANRILSSISDQFSVSLETQRAGSDGVSVVETLDLNVKRDGLLCGFSSLSGGEQFRIALSMRIALSELATQHGGSSLEFLLLDEINSPLDKNGVETLFVNIIKQLEAKYKILVITHDDILKERFENILDISKINGESFVSFSATNNVS